jgi:precorrin-2 dehydrogenase/sirohydrochlorin ferrochelatase
MGRLYPVFIRLEGLNCLVVGGGAVAGRKVRGLLAAGARIRIVAPDLTPDLRAILDETREQITWAGRPFRQEDIDDATLVFAATNDPVLNEKICLACREKGILVNAATGPESGTFMVPAVVDRGRLQIAVSTTGASPAVAKMIRQELEAYFPAAYGDYLAWMEKARGLVKASLDEQSERERQLLLLAESALLDLLKTGKRIEAEALFQDWANQMVSSGRTSTDEKTDNRQQAE